MFYFTITESQPLGDHEILGGIIRGYNILTPPTFPLKAYYEGRKDLGYVLIESIRLEGNFPNAAWASMTISRKTPKNQNFVENIMQFDTISDYDLFSKAQAGIISQPDQPYRFAKSSLLRLRNIRQTALVDAAVCLLDLDESEKTEETESLRTGIMHALRYNLLTSILPSYAARIPAEDDTLYYRMETLKNKDHVLLIYPSMESSQRHILDAGNDGDEVYPVYADGICSMVSANPQLHYMLFGTLHPILIHRDELYSLMK